MPYGLGDLSPIGIMVRTVENSELRNMEKSPRQVIMELRLGRGDSHILKFCGFDLRGRNEKKRQIYVKRK